MNPMFYSLDSKLEGQKQIYNELQKTHNQTLLLSVLPTSVQGKEQVDWDAIAERIHNAGETSTPLHLKIKAYHVDLACKDV